MKDVAGGGRRLSVGKRLGDLRHRLSLRDGQTYTQEWLATAAGVTKSAVAKWETDVTIPGEDSLQRLAEIYDTSVGYILQGDSPAALSEDRPAEETPEDAMAETDQDWMETALRTVRLLSGVPGDDPLQVKLLKADILKGVIRLGRFEGRDTGRLETLLAELGPLPGAAIDASFFATEAEAALERARAAKEFGIAARIEAEEMQARRVDAARFSSPTLDPAAAAAAKAVEAVARAAPSLPPLPPAGARADAPDDTRPSPGRS